MKGLIGMLINKEYEVGISGNNLQYYEQLGYIIPKYIDNQGRIKVKRGTKIKVDVKDLPNKSNIKVDVECDGCGKKLENVIWQDYLKRISKNGKYYCKSCASKLYGKGSQYKLSEQEIRNIIDEKLGIDWKIENIQIKKHTHVTLIDPEGYWYYSVSINNIKTKNHIPLKFHKTNKYTKQNINLWCKINNFPIELIGNYKDAIKRLKWKCLDCNNIFYRSWSDIHQKHILCPVCSDNISYPEKFGLSLFNQLNIDYDYNSKINWSKNNKYDFLVHNLKIVVETNGLQHYEEANWGKLGGRTLKEEQENDKIKKELAEQNGYKYIEIDCRYSDFEYIKNNILYSELNSIFDLTKIDWLKCHEYACSNRVKEACDLWNNGVKSAIKIGIIMKMARSTIRRYLKQGTTLEWCDYDSKEVQRKARRENGIKNGKPVIQLDLNRNYIAEFNSASEAERKIGIKHISSVCHGKRNHAGGFKWIYKKDYDEYIKQQNISA